MQPTRTKGEVEREEGGEEGKGRQCRIGQRIKKRQNKNIISMEQSQAGKDKKPKIKAKHIQNTHAHTHLYTHTPAHSLGKLDKTKWKFMQNKDRNLLGREIETQYKSTLDKDFADREG